MFEEEIALEKKSSSLGPVVMIAALVLIVVGGLGYIIFQSKKTLKPEDAAQVIEQTLKAKGPATTAFQTGLIGWSTATEPHYTVLEKAGFVTIGKPDANARKQIKLTPKGEQALAAFPEFPPQKDADGTAEYTVPLAARKLLEVQKVTMQGPNVAFVQYSWKWEPNSMGELFDASGKELQALSSWQRATVIQKHGADYYHAAPASTTVKLVVGKKGWQLATE
ncbi:MAG TPA: hypothetical protein VN622_11575 [Clostridia bacterium]|nr:hypothetical protein [Clostridia bacterium]